MMITLPDLTQAADELETIGRKVFDLFEPLWDADERMYRHAIAVLRTYLEETSQP